MTTPVRVAAAGSPVRAVSRLPSLKSPTGFTERVVVGRSTAQWLHTTFGLTGFGPLDTTAQLHQVGDRETKQPVESYLALAELVEEPIALEKYIQDVRKFVNDNHQPPVPAGVKDSMRKEVMLPVLKGVSSSTANGAAFLEALRSAARTAVDGTATAAQFDMFCKFYDAGDAAPVGATMSADGNISTDNHSLREKCDAFVAVDLRACAPLLTGEALRFDVLPAVVHAAGWTQAPGVDACLSWYADGCDLFNLPTRNDKPCPVHFIPDFGFVGMEDGVEIQKLNLRPVAHPRLGPDGTRTGDVDFIWYGTGHARLQFSRAGTTKQLVNWTDLQACLQLVNRSINQVELYKILQGGVTGCRVIMDELEAIRADAIKRRYLHRILPYPASLREYEHPRRSPGDGEQNDPVAWLHRVVVDNFISPWVLHSTPDQAELRLAFLLQVGGLYAIMVASMLSVFVQQGCPGPNGTTASCSFYEKTDARYDQNRRYWPRLVLAWNCITLITFIITNGALFMRERFLIKYFDSMKLNPVAYLHGEPRLDGNGRVTYTTAAAFANHHLFGLGWLIDMMQKRTNGLLSWLLTGDRVDNELRRYPRIKYKLDFHNTNALFLSLLCFLFLLLNFIFTACLLFSSTYRRYGGSITVISLLSNTQLILMRVVTWIQKAKQAHDEGSAVSIFMTVPKCANSIDKDYLFKTKYYQPDEDDDTDEDTADALEGYHTTASPAQDNEPLHKMADGAGSEPGGADERV